MRVDGFRLSHSHGFWLGVAFTTDIVLTRSGVRDVWREFTRNRCLSVRKRSRRAQALSSVSVRSRVWIEL